METIILAGDITDWIDNTTSWARSTLPVIFLAVVMLFGVWLLIVTRGGIRKVLVFGLGAAAVYMVLTHVGAIADMFGSEITKGAPALGPRPAVVTIHDRSI